MMILKRDRMMMILIGLRGNKLLDLNPDSGILFCSSKELYRRLDGKLRLSDTTI